ncbi:MAG TPA: PHP domain-containing protein [bacterium]|nr:PHP domain-containing protein [bacterium]
MTNTDIIIALQRWSFDPGLGPYARVAVTRASRRLLEEESSLADRAVAGSLTELRLVGPFIARVIRELLDGSRPLTPPVEDWRGEERAMYDAAAMARDHFIAVRDARVSIAEAGWPRPLGDLQMHTAWSDGAASPRAMAAAAQRLGYQFAAITDHTQGLRFAGGMPVQKMRRQRQVLARLNDQMAIRVLAGAEVNVAAAGALDLDREDLAGLEIVVAGCHAALRRTEDQTPRMLAAVAHPSVHLLVHPRGRMFGVPRGIRAAWDEVFSAAAEYHTAIEINAYPDRQDVDFTLAGPAARAGCLISLGTDSHAVRHLGWMDVAVAHLIRAGISRERVLNYWNVAALERWLSEKRV